VDLKERKYFMSWSALKGITQNRGGNVMERQLASHYGLEKHGIKDTGFIY